MPVPEILRHTIDRAKEQAGDGSPPRLSTLSEVQGRMQELEQVPQQRLEKKEREKNAGESLVLFHHAMEFESLRYQHRLFLLQSKESGGEKVDPLDRQAAALNVTYYQYLPQVTQRYFEVWNHYQQLANDPTMPPLPAALKKREQVLQSEYIELSLLLEQRGLLHECYFIRRRIRLLEGEQKSEERDEKLKRQWDLLRGLSGKLPPPASEAALAPGYAHAAEGIDAAIVPLQGRILGILRGKTEDGRRSGDTPLELYADTLKEIYSTFAQRERDVAGSVRIPHAMKASVLEELNRLRSGMADEMIRAIGVQGQYQIRMARLTAMQNMFDQPEAGFLTQIDSIKPTPPNIGEIRNKLQAFADDATESRLRSIEGHLAFVDKNILNVTPELQLEDFWDKHGREAVNVVLEKIVNIVTAPLVIVPGLREAQRENILGPLYEAMGFPPGVRDYNALTETQQQAVLAKAKQSYKECILAFDRTELEQTKGTSALLRDVQKRHPASGRFGERTGDLAAMKTKYPRITAENVEKVIAASNVATAYSLLYDQLENEFGGPEHLTGYFAQIDTLSKGIQEVMKSHLDFASAYRHMARELNPIPSLDMSLWFVAGGTGAVLGSGKEGIAAGKAVLKSGVRAMVGIPPWISGNKAPPLPRAAGSGASVSLGAAGVGYFGYELYQDWKEARSFHDFKETVKQHIDFDVASMQKELGELVKQGLYRQIDDRTFAHAETGITVTLPEPSQFTDSLETQMLECYVRAGKDAALGMRLLMRLLKVKGFTGPIGLTLTAIQLGYEGAADVWTHTNTLAFLRDAPTWVVASFGTANLVRKPEYDILTHEFGTRFSRQSPEQKTEARSKLFYAMYCQELQETGDRLWEISAGMRNAADLQVAYEGDFKNIILPYAFVCLQRETGGSWEALSQGKIDDGLVILPPNVTSLQVRKALREAMAVHLQHVREKQYLAVCRDVATLEGEVAQAEGGGVTLQVSDQKRKELADMRFAANALGNMRVFGRRLVDDLPPDARAAGAGKTRTERLVGSLFDRGGSSGTLPSMEGLPSSVRLADSSEVMGYVEDPALRLQLGTVHPRTMAETAERGGQRWNDWYSFTVKPFKQIQSPAEATLMGSYGNIDFQRSYAIAAADRIRMEQGMPALKSDPTLSSVFLGASGNEKSLELARASITEDAVKLFEQKERANDPSKPFVRRQEYEEKLFPRPEGKPLVYQTDLHMPFDLCAALVRMQPDGSDFPPDRLCAVFFESVRLEKSKDAVVLATFMYGEPERRKVTLFQCAATHAQLKTSAERAVPGFLEPVPLSQIGKRRSLTSALNQLLHDRRERKEQQEMQHLETQVLTEQKDREQREAERKIIASLPADSFVEVRPRTYAMAFASGKRSDVFTFSRPGTAISAKEQPKAHYEGEEFTFTFTSDGKERRYTVGADFLKRQDLMLSEQAIFRRVLTAPVQGDDRASLERIVSLFPHDVYRSRLFRDRFYRAELLENLMPLYQSLKTDAQRRQFLDALLKKLDEEGSITGESAERVAKWFKVHNGDFLFSRP
ncbi:MAG: hypothetical protein PHW10_05600 [Candidatus Peribacteraceae bacterium]|nr:hypothetical protein [Candidatus Peribacteraceae bacterium]